jgi:hypothetical protein
MAQDRSRRRGSPGGAPSHSGARPPVAVGHVFLSATAVAAAATWLERVGLRPIFKGDEVAVLELRGGTHLVVTPAERPPAKGSAAPFDLMVDDIEAARLAFAADGLKPTRIRHGSIHASFRLAGPDGYIFTIVSSHAGDRIV